MTRDDDWVALSRNTAIGKALTQEEIDSVLVRLKEDIDPYEKYPLIHALGSLQDPRFVPAIESCLDEKRAPQVAGLALRILCTDLKLSDHYVDQIAAFVDGLPWDEAEDARLIAIQVAGEHLRHHQSAELLERLLHIEGDHDERALVRDVARGSLARAIGVEWKNVSAARKDEILVRARERLG